MVESGFVARQRLRLGGVRRRAVRRRAHWHVDRAEVTGGLWPPKAGTPAGGRSARSCGDRNGKRLRRPRQAWPEGGRSGVVRSVQSRSGLDRTLFRRSGRDRCPSFGSRPSYVCDGGRTTVVRLRGWRWTGHCQERRRGGAGNVALGVQRRPDESSRQSSPPSLGSGAEGGAGWCVTVGSRRVGTGGRGRWGRPWQCLSSGAPTVTARAQCSVRFRNASAGRSRWTALSRPPSA